MAKTRARFARLSVSTTLAKLKRSRPLNHDVFINCPFDADYTQCFEAILFVVCIAGYSVRCALEDDDAGDVRFDKLCRLIEASDRSIHDLSRTSPSAEGLPRFNMPFELGLMMGAKKFGGRRQRRKRAVIMVKERFVMPKFLSDLAGNDPAAHGDNPHRVIAIIRDHLEFSRDGTRLPGAQKLAKQFSKFKSDLPKLAAAQYLELNELDPYANYRDYLDLVLSYCQTVAEKAREAYLTKR
jgi:hypothetical protein